MAIGSRYLQEGDGGSGIMMLLAEFRERGTFDAQTMVRLLETRRQLLSKLPDIDIWRPLGSVRIGNLRRYSLFEMKPKGWSRRHLEQTGIFFSAGMRDPGQIWFGLLRSKLDDTSNIIQPARWVKLVLAGAVDKDPDPTNRPELTMSFAETLDMMELYHHKPGFILGELERAVQQAKDHLLAKASIIENLGYIFQQEKGNVLLYTTYDEKLSEN